jgi:exonuclease III/ubiquitin
MKGIFWNSRGLGDLAKHNFLSNLSKEQHLNFIAIMETGRRDFSDSTLRHLCGGVDFLWHSMPPRGRSGGMLLGVNPSVFDIGAIDEGDFYCKFRLRNKVDGFIWTLFAVYGPAQDDLKSAFLAEMASACGTEPHPFIIGGDFNIMRRPEDKNNSNFNYRWPNLFNAVIESLELREIEMTSRQYTWSNDLDPPTFEKLDRVLMSPDWELKFSNVTVKALDRARSDHTPLLLNGRVAASTGNHGMFKFELGWLIRDGFHDMVTSIWENETRGNNSMEKWQKKIRAVRQHLRGWAKNTAGTMKKEKVQLTKLIDDLDKKAEVTRLSPNELAMKAFINERLAGILREEEIRLFQRAKVKHLLEGDDNTKYFQLVANGKHRKERIYSLEDDNRPSIVDEEELKKHITSYYKGLFGKPNQTSVELEESFTHDIPQVSDAENEILTAPFVMEEVRKAVFQMKHNKAPGPDRFPVEFYQVF